MGDSVTLLWNDALDLWVLFGPASPVTESWIWDGEQWLRPGLWSDWEWIG
jgi:hypothetical protein